MYNSFDICREILEHYGLNEYTEWIGNSDINKYLNEYYPEMPDNDRWFVYDRMEKIVDYIDDYRSINENDEEFDEEFDEE